MGESKRIVCVSALAAVAEPRVNAAATMHMAIAPTRPRRAISVARSVGVAYVSWTLPSLDGGMDVRGDSLSSSFVERRDGRFLTKEALPSRLSSGEGRASSDFKRRSVL